MKHKYQFAWFKFLLAHKIGVSFFLHNWCQPLNVLSSLEMAQGKGSHVETCPQLCFYWRLMDKGRKQSCFDVHWTSGLGHVLETNVTFWLFPVPAVIIVSWPSVFKYIFLHKYHTGATGNVVVPNSVPTWRESHATSPSLGLCRRLQQILDGVRAADSCDVSSNYRISEDLWIL